MTIRNRLTFISSVTFGVVFTIAAVLVYYAFYTSSERIIFNEMEKACMLSAMFYLEEDELSAREHRLIKKEFEESVLQTDIKIYDGNDHITFGNDQWDEEVTADVLDQVRREGKVSFKAKDHYYFGIFYPDNQGDFVVFIVSNNVFFASQSNQLLLMLGIALTVGLGVILLLSHWLSRIAYKPVSTVIKQVSSMEADSLETALISPNTGDELQDLVDTFNSLLKRLAETFVIQKNFINYVSHEFKTPLAAISGNLEVFAQKGRSETEYQAMAQEVLKDAYQIETILNNLMVLSGLRHMPSSVNSFRVDELLWSVLDRIYAENPLVKTWIALDIQVGDPEQLKKMGNAGQMEMALYNLVENAVKYSEDKSINITLTGANGQLSLYIKDHGKGIPVHELKYIHQPFYRGSNVGDTKGSGIGLSLAVLICKQNQVRFSIDSVEGRGTTIQLGWPLATR